MSAFVSLRNSRCWRKREHLSMGQQVICDCHQETGFAWMSSSLKTATARQGEAYRCCFVKCFVQEGATNFLSSPSQPVLTLRSWKPTQAPLLYYLHCGTMELTLKTTSVSSLRLTLSLILCMNVSPGIILLMSWRHHYISEIKEAACGRKM